MSLLLPVLAAASSQTPSGEFVAGHSYYQVPGSSKTGAPENIFDGSLATYFGFANSDQGCWQEINFTGTLRGLTFTTVEVYALADSLAGLTYELSVNDGTPLLVQGGPSWKAFTINGPLFKVRFDHTATRSGAGGGAIYAIRVDGKVLDTDWASS